MTLSNFLKIAQIALIASAFVFATTYAPVEAVAAGKPSFAGKPEEKLGKGGRSAFAQEELKKEKEKKEKKAKKEKKVKKVKKAKKGKKK